MKQINYNIPLLVLLLALCFLPFICKAEGAQFALQSMVLGQVTDSTTGEPLPGVDISVKGTTIGTATDRNGRYRLSVPSLNDTLVISFIGYRTKAIAINGRKSINIAIASITISGKELVVVGYGRQEQRMITGAISSVSAKEIHNQSVSSFEQLLQGHVPGVQVNQNSSAPGGGISVRIRGTNSILSSGEPLYVIDGVPINSPNGAPVINPDNIQSIEILKDASSTSIYGSRGSNGVVLITTKTGVANHQDVTIRAEYGIQEMSKSLNLLNAKEFVTLANEAVTNYNKYQSPDQQMALLYPDASQFGEGTDWEKVMYRAAPTQNYDLRFSGGNGTTQYAISGNYRRQKGIRINTGLQRGGIRINMSSKFRKKLKFGEHLSLNRISLMPQNKMSLTTGRVGRGSVVGLSTILMFPTLPVKYSDGSYALLTDAPASPEYRSPVEISREVTNKLSRNYVVGNIYGEYDIQDNLKVKVSFGGNINNEDHRLYIPTTLKLYRSGPDNPGTASVENRKYTSWLNENTVTYDFNIKENNKFDLLGGISFQKTNSYSDVSSVEQFGNDYSKYNNLSGGSNPQLPSSDYEESSIISYYGRLRYNRSDKYLLALTLRTDGSSRFGKDNKYGFFPSGSVGWIISDESFMKNINSINFLKLRAGYGITGNQEIGNYGSYGLMEAQLYPFGDVSNVTYLPSTLGNPDLKWEKTSEFDIGLNAKLFNSRISIDMDYYHKKTSNLLLNVNVPSSSGFSSVLENAGSLSNKGWELSLQTDNVRGEFNWSTGINFSLNRNKVISIGPSSQLFFSSDLQNGNVIRDVTPGQPINSLFGYVFDGLWQSQDQIDAAGTQPLAHPGDPRFKDLNGDGVIDADDRTIIGNTSPDFVFGMSNRLHYKGYSLSFFLQGVYGNDIVNAQRTWLLGIDGTHNNSKAALNRWTPDHTKTDIPAASFSRTYTKLSDSSWMLEKGSYIRLKNVRFSYDFPVRVLDELDLNSASVFIDLENLYTITNYSGYNPDVNTNGQDNIQRGEDDGSYPLARVFSIGLNISL